MKLPKTLLAAMLTGITLQAVQSCTKKTDDPKTEEQKAKEKAEKEAKEKCFPYSCTACGMG